MSQVNSKHVDSNQHLVDATWLKLITFHVTGSTPYGPLNRLNRGTLAIVWPLVYGDKTDKRSASERGTLRDIPLFEPGRSQIPGHLQSRYPFHLCFDWSREKSRKREHEEENDDKTENVAVERTSPGRHNKDTGLDNAKALELRDRIDTTRASEIHDHRSQSIDQVRDRGRLRAPVIPLITQPQYKHEDRYLNRQPNNAQAFSRIPSSRIRSSSIHQTAYGPNNHFQQHVAASTSHYIPYQQQPGAASSPTYPSTAYRLSTSYHKQHLSAPSRQDVREVRERFDRVARDLAFLERELSPYMSEVAHALKAASSSVATLVHDVVISTSFVARESSPVRAPRERKRHRSEGPEAQDFLAKLAAENQAVSNSLDRYSYRK
ncbi:hypothetical protein MMC13_007793 [Lambiella insularis]|nr:hypothetical protein [Lambiella insularis]